MAKEAIILAGGIGSRLQSVISEIPKPLAPINDIPFLTYLLELCAQFEYTKVVLSVGYKHEKIKTIYGNNYKKIDLVYAVEHEKLGTGGAINFALDFCQTENVLILNGDSIVDVNLNEFGHFHQNNNSLFTLALKPLESFDRYGSVEIEGNKVVKFNEKKHTDQGLINTGVYLLNRLKFKELNFKKVFSFEEVFLEEYYCKWTFYGYITTGFFIDIGIPTDYERAQTLLPLEFKILPS